MNTIGCENGQLSILNTKSGQPILIPLSSLRLVYLFLPQHFHWHFIVPSETAYRFTDLDSLSIPELEQLRGQLAAQPEAAAGSFVFLLKNVQGWSFKISLKDFRTNGIDIVQEIINSQSGRKSELDRWMLTNPSVPFTNLVFNKDQVQQGKKSIPWPALDHYEIRQTQSIGTTTYFHFIPVKGSGYKKFFQGMRPESTEECLAEISHWRTVTLGEEQIQQVQENQQEANTTASNQVKRSVWITIFIIILLVCSLSVVLLSLARG